MPLKSEMYLAIYWTQKCNQMINYVHKRIKITMYVAIKWIQRCNQLIDALNVQIYCNEYGPYKTLVV